MAESQPLSEKAPNQQASDADGQPQDKQEKEQHGSQQPEKKEENKDSKQPAGGYDKTPISKQPPGWTVKVTFHRATNLPMADLNSLSSDPYVIAQINTDLPSRHKEDPELRLRTPTIRRNVDPEWNTEWIVANVPSSGFKIKARVYDEDPADHDDRLGNVHVHVDHVDDKWPGIKDQPYKIMKRSGSKRAYFIRAFAACFNKAKHLNGDLYISVEVLGRTEDKDGGGRMYTIGPCWWTRHYSPMLGRLANRKEPDEDEDLEQNSHDSASVAEKKKKRKAERYNFQANQIQLPGPVPKELYHRYVEFRPFVKSMFTNAGLRGFVLSKALHHQHARVYNFDRSTTWGRYPEGPCQEMTKAFLDLVHYDEGGRIFTYVLTLDSLLRFTETGKEFGIDLLSKHTMHSDVSIYIAFSGEFFVRRLKHSNRPPPPEPVEDTSHVHPPEHKDNPTHPAEDVPGGPPNRDPPKDPAHYELVIDNDSGTYRPNADLLPLLKDFLSRALPGLHILTLDCQADSERMEKMKQEQRDKKAKEGDKIVFTQGSDAGSISSSDEEDLDQLEAEEREQGDTEGVAKTLKREAEMRNKGRLHNLKQYGKGAGKLPRDGGSDDGDEEGADAAEEGGNA
ncbi:hypothetical protein M8818_001677 [Zalaria obscura]|uniref:Uncharacterized protein n=1 Tax=Zalaria obscura TaxID=2024903 RepID=A0ACC3SJN2_9PEZI